MPGVDDLTVLERMKAHAAAVIEPAMKAVDPAAGLAFEVQARIPALAPETAARLARLWSRWRTIRRGSRCRTARRRASSRRQACRQWSAVRATSPRRTSPTNTSFRPRSSAASICLRASWSVSCADRPTLDKLRRPNTVFCMRLVDEQRSGTGEGPVRKLARRDSLSDRIYLDLRQRLQRGAIFRRRPAGGSRIGRRIRNVADAGA